MKKKAMGPPRRPEVVKLFVFSCGLSLSLFLRLELAPFNNRTDMDPAREAGVIKPRITIAIPHISADISLNAETSLRSLARFGKTNKESLTRPKIVNIDSMNYEQ